MKKLLALFMALVLSASSFTSIAFATDEVAAENVVAEEEVVEETTAEEAIAEETKTEEVEVKVDEMTEEARKFVEYFEVLDTEAGLEYDVTRAEFAVYLARVLGMNEYSQTEITYYNDVTSEHWAAVCINNLAEIGALTIGEDKLFRPNDSIKIEEAVKIIINLLGYENSAALKGGFAEGYMGVARQLRLLENVSQSGNLINSDAADLLLNMINIDIYEATFEDGDILYRAVEDKGILAIYRNMYIIEGTVRAVHETALHEGDELDGSILIDNTRYNWSGDSQYIGHYVKAYYTQASETDIPEVAFMISKTSAENILTIDAKNIESFSSDYVLEYYKSENSAKTTRVTIPRNASVIYNGIAISKNIADKIDMEQGTITLLKTKGSSDYDVVIIREYETFVVSYADTSKKIVVDIGDPENMLDLSGENGTVKIFDVHGNLVNFSAIGKNYALTVYQTPGKYIEVYVSETKITGLYSGTEVEDGDHYITVNDVRYKVSPKYYSEIEKMLTSGRDIKFIVDMFGDIAYIDTVGAESGYIWGYYINQNLNTDEDEVLYIKLYSEADGIKRYIAAERVKIDGKNHRKPATISKALTDSLDATDTILRGMPDAVATISSRLIRFKLNAAGQISQIDTPYTGANETKTDALFIDTVLPAIGNSSRTTKSIYIDGKDVIVGFTTIINNTSTLSFRVPTDDLVANATEQMFKTGEGYEQNAESITYKTSPKSGAAEVIVVAAPISTTIESYNAIMVSNISTGLDEDERVVEYVEGYLGQTPVQYTMASNARDWNGNKISMSEAGVDIGDIVSLIFNAAGEIETFLLSYDCSEDICYDAPAVEAITDASGNVLVAAKRKKTMFTNNVLGSKLEFYDCFYNYGTFTKGYANTYTGGILGISAEKGGENIVRYSVNSRTAMVYDKELKKNGFSTGTASDIITYEEAGNACVTIVAVHHAANWQWYYIYK